jgi:hypothetical protein
MRRAADSGMPSSVHHAHRVHGKPVKGKPAWDPSRVYGLYADGDEDDAGGEDAAPGY